jgi:uncharacterized protein (TIGR03437 family)
MRLVFIVSALSLFAATGFAQQDRITSAVDPSHVAALTGNVRPMARAEFDEGPLDPSQRLSSITLVLKPSASQKANLSRLLADQQDPLSPNYHKWLTPDQYADRFGLSRGDIAKIVAWLRSEGLSVDDIARGRNWVVFSGAVALVQRALHTEIRHYRVAGELHFANATEPSVPAALLPLVIGIRGLDDFRPKPSAPVRPAAPGNPSPNLHPRFTDNNGNHTLAPDDLATIYDLTPIYQLGYDGTGMTLVIAGQTDVDLQDIQNFRNYVNLSNNLPTLMKVPSSVDPGTTGDLGEADLDLEWSGAVARNATILYVYSTNVIDSVSYAVSQNLGQVISLSYSHCELQISASGASDLQALAQQANAQGITWIVSSGDSGAASCDLSFQSPGVAQYGQNTSIFASIPEVTGVGGTEFNEAGGNYWSNFNTTSGASALGYIPEMAWNESSSNGLASTGGGFSIFYNQPSWQKGPGVPSQNQRAVPDVSLSSAAHDGYIGFTGGNQVTYSGTSASAPSFAGVVTLLNQYEVANAFQKTPGQGNLNPNLYRLAQSSPGVFHDITSGNNIVPCQVGTPGCTTGSYGYSAGPGYDPVTGLGSVDGNNLLAEWNNQLVSTTTTVTANPTSVTVNSSTQLTATVAAVGSSAVPTGTVAFNLGTTAIGSAPLVSSGTTATATITVYGSQLTGGTDTIRASYSGSSSFNGSSGTVNLSVSLPAQNSAVVPSVTPDPVFEQAPDANGYGWFYTVQLTEVAGTATTLTGFTINGANYSMDIVKFFGSASLPAHGTLSAPLASKGLTVPTKLVFGFTGMDASGTQWSQQLSVPFYAMQITAAMSLTSFPGTVREDPTAPQDCLWAQYLGVQELNGHSVQITKFLTGGEFGTLDLTSQILEFFPSKTLPALGTLVGSICWSGISPLPQAKNYEIDGVDDTGTPIVATATATFDVPATGGALSISQDSIMLSPPGSSQAASTSIGVNVNFSAPWTVTIFPSNRNTSWLTVFPQSGVGPATLNVSADATGLSSGVYQTFLVFQSTNTTPQFAPVPLTFTVGSGSQAKPIINSVVNGASFVQPGGMVPGEIATIFGENLTSLAGINLTSGLPLPKSFFTVTVSVDGKPAPLFAVDDVNGNQQINFQVPWEVGVEQSANVVVTNNGVPSAVMVVPVLAAQPGIIMYNSGGQNFGVILHKDYKPVNAGNPAVPGETLQIYCTGLGAVSPPMPATGAVAGPDTETVTKATVTIGGLDAPVTFSGLAPNFVGLNQVNAHVPLGAQHGNQQIIVTIDGAPSVPVLIPIE